MSTENAGRQLPSANIVKFSFSFRANGKRITYTVETREANNLVITEDSNGIEKQGKVALGFMTRIEALIRKHKLYEWAGFRESSPDHQYICESFFLEIEFEGNPKKSERPLFDFHYMEELENSTNIYAEGSSAFPIGFFDAMQEIFKLFGSVKLKKAPDFDTISQREERSKRSWRLWGRKQEKE